MGPMIRGSVRKGGGMGDNPHRAPDEIREKVQVWEFFGCAEEGIFVEVGANDPKSLSQTWFLEKMGWRGVLVEPLPDLAEGLRRERRNSMVFEVAVSAPGKTGEADFHVAGAFSSLAQNVKDNAVDYGTVLRVKVVTLDSVLEEAKIRKVDFLSVDTEGTEVDVFRGFDIGRYRPALILVEDAVFGLKLHRHLKSSRYRLVRRTGFNNWYVPEDSPFRPTLHEKLRLFRKMYLGTPVRVLKFRLQSIRTRRGS
ncbi:MAG: FkbM family methyltransferase [bacterium]|nr:FkbM family methyltransferase [bacterium]